MYALLDLMKKMYAQLKVKLLGVYSTADQIGYVRALFGQE